MDSESMAKNYIQAAEFWMDQKYSDPGTVASANAYATLAVASALVALLEKIEQIKRPVGIIGCDGAHEKGSTQGCESPATCEQARP